MSLFNLRSVVLVVSITLGGIIFTDSITAAPPAEGLDTSSTANSAAAPLVSACVVGRWDGYGGLYADVWGEGNYAYLAHYANGDGNPARVFVIDISNPANPVLDETLFIPPPNDDASPQDIKVGDGLLFVALEADGDDGVAIYDIRDPANRKFLTTVTVGIPPFVFIHNLFYEGGFLYVADSWFNLAIIDLRSFDPDNPPASPITNFKWVLLGVTTGFVHDVTVRNGRLYVSGWDSLSIYDVSNVGTTFPTLIGTTPGIASHSSWPTDDGKFVVTGEERFGGGIKVYEITDLGGSLSLTLTDSLALEGAFSVHNQLIVGNRLYNSWYGRGLQIFDIDTNGLLDFVAEYDTSSSGLGNWGVYPFLGEDRILLSDEEEGLFVVELVAGECSCAPSATPLMNPSMVDTGKGGSPRFFSFSTANPGLKQAIRVTFPDPMPSPYEAWSSMQTWVSPPTRYCENSAKGAAPNDIPPNYGCDPAPGLPQRWYMASTLQCDAQFMDWHGTCDGSTCLGGLRSGLTCVTDSDCSEPVYVFHEGIIPGTGPHNEPAFTPTTYNVQAIARDCNLANDANYSISLSATTSKWGDTVENTASSPYPPPQGLVGITDVLAQLAKFQNTNLASVSARVDLLGATEPKYLPDHKIDIGDVVQGLFAFTAVKYPSPAITGVPNPRPCSP